jgi:hypothetical protein
VGYAAVRLAVRRASPRLLVGHLASVAPVIVTAALWYPNLAKRGFDTPPLWMHNTFERLSFTWWSDSSLGGLRGLTEDYVFAALLLWMGAGLWQWRKELRERVDGVLLLAAALFAAVALVLPDKYENTIRFAPRWVPAAVTLFLLALPMPRLKPVLARAAAVGLLAIFSLSTSFAWLTYQERDLSGLAEALEALPERPRVLGLDWVKESETIEGRPFVQTFAYAQVRHGGELNFSFADFAPSLVVYKDLQRVRWTSGLEWFAEWVTDADFRHFDFALVGGDEQVHERLGGAPHLQPVTREGTWRLYRIARERTGP